MDSSFSSWPNDEPPPNDNNNSGSDKPKKPRHRHSALHLKALNELYDKNDHPPLDERQALAEKLGMETKTVNAWFQNKRASTKKRHRGGPPTVTTNSNSNVDLPPISTLLASAPPSTSSATSRTIEHDTYDSDFHIPAFPPHRMEKPSARSHQVVLLEETPRQQSAFYAGNPEHHHSLSRDNSPPAVDLSARPRMRMRPTSQQTDELRRFYQVNPHPTKEEREDLSERIGMRYQSITNWFQNQRSMAKKRQEEDAELEAEATKDKSERIYASFPPHHHTQLPPNPALALLHARNRSPSLPPSNGSVSSRASPYRNLPPSQRPRRTRPEAYQLEALQKLYNRTHNPSIEERSALALEVGMDLAKVTNWFRNIRQTARKRSRKHGDDGDTDSMQLNSTSVSRAATPADFWSSESSVAQDHDMDTDADDADHRMDHDEDEHYLHAPKPVPARVPSNNSDPATDDEEHEPKTPSPEPAPRTFDSVSYMAPPVSRPRNLPYPIDDHTYAKLKQMPGRVSGVEVEDALLLLGFHHHIVH